MLVKTKNSTYRVTGQGDRFLVQKVSVDNIESVFMGLGESRVSNYLTLQVGEPMRFHHVITSPVVSVTEE